MAKQGWGDMVKGELKKIGAEMDAIGREGLKDARSLIMGEWGKGCEEPGTPGNLTSQQVTASFETDHEKWLAERAEMAKGHDKDRGQEMSR